MPRRLLIGRPGDQSPGAWGAPTGESRPGAMAAAAALEPQRRGRLLVLGSCGAALLCSAALCVLSIVWLRAEHIARNETQKAAVALFGAAAAALGAAVLVPTGINRSAYASRSYLAAVGGALVPAVLLAVVLISLWPVPELYTAVIAAAAAAFLSVPGGVLLTRRASSLHPFAMPVEAVRDPPPGTQSRPEVPAAHRVAGGLFDDWPEPQPFVAEALYAYARTTSSELSFRRGDRLVVVDCRGNWWQARHTDSGLTGFVPSNYIRVLRRATVVDSCAEGFVARHPDEVSVRPGEGLEVMEVHEQMSLVRTAAGRIGSVPTALLSLQPLAPEDAVQRYAAQ